MTRLLHTTLIFLIAALASVSPAFTQPGTVPTRGFLVVNSGYELTANDFSDGATKRENAEDGRFDSTYVVKGGPAFDIAGGVFSGVGSASASASAGSLCQPRVLLRPQSHIRSSSTGRGR